MDRHLSPEETARRFGVSTKALRLYERRGLLAPLRSQSGWRTYGPAEVARLHQILALKQLGLSVARIGEVLHGPGDLDAVLAVQEQVLARQSERLSRTQALLRAARTKLADGRALSIDDLATLTQETVMNTKPSAEEIEKIKVAFAPVIAKHFTPAEVRKLERGRNDREAEMIAFKALVEKAMTEGDATSPLARQVAEQYRAMGRVLSSGDPVLMEKIRAFRKDAQSDPRLSGLMFFSLLMQDFIDRAVARLG